MTGTTPWKRLTALASLPNHHTMLDAANALGCHPTTLRDYITRLERELGQPLLRRPSPPGDLFTLTEHGAAVVAAVTTVQEAQA